MVDDTKKGPGAAGKKDAPAPGQAAAVDEALKGGGKRDIDRWEGFSEAEADKLQDDPAPPEGAEKPRAGLPRKGGVVEGK